MSTVAGVYSETLLNNVFVKLSQLMLDDRVKLQYKPNAESLKALRAVSTARVSELEGSKQTKVSVWWDNACGLEDREQTDCTFGGEKTSTNIQEYEIDIFREVPFTVNEHDFVDNYADFEEHLAKALLRSDVILMEYLAEQFISKLNTGKGVNALTSPYTVVGSDTEIPSASWTADLFAYLAYAAGKNQFASPVLLNDGNLYSAYMQAKFNAGNDDGKGDVAAFNYMPIYFDMFRLAAVNGSDVYSYMINQGSFAWANKNYFKPATVIEGDYTRFRMPTSFGELLPITYDVILKKSCTTNDLTQIEGKVKLNCGIFQNPTGCDADNTNVLSFKKTS